MLVRQEMLRDKKLRAGIPNGVQQKVVRLLVPLSHTYFKKASLMVEMIRWASVLKRQSKSVQLKSAL